MPKPLNKTQKGWIDIILKSNLDLSSFTNEQAITVIKETPTRDGRRKNYPQYAQSMNVVLLKHPDFTYVRLANKLGNIWTYIGDEKNAD